LTRITPLRINKKNYETQFSSNTILKDEIEKKSIEKEKKKKDPSQPNLTLQTRGLRRPR